MLWRANAQGYLCKRKEPLVDEQVVNSSILSHHLERQVVVLLEPEEAVDETIGGIWVEGAKSRPLDVPEGGLN